MTRAEYFRLCRTMSTDWLTRCLELPSRQMTPRHRALIALALRKRGAL
jgi:hypothetical protein